MPCSSSRLESQTHAGGRSHGAQSALIVGRVARAWWCAAWLLSGCAADAATDAVKAAAGAARPSDEAGAATTRSARTAAAAATAASATAVPAPSVSPSWQAQIQKLIADGEYAPRAEGERFVVVNRAQAFVAQFDGAGAELAVREGPRSVIRIGAVSLARGGATQRLTHGNVGLGACRADGTRDAQGQCVRGVQSMRGQVTELWENRKDGLEHSFHVASAPAGKGPLELLVGVQGASVLVASAGDEARIVAREGSLHLRYTGLRAWDANLRALPAHMQQRGNGIVLVVDTQGAQYPITIDPLLTSVAWSAESNQVGAGFGVAVASAGDVNGDGYGDVIVGSSGYDNGELDEGRAFVFLGASSGLSSSAAWTAEGDQAAARFGGAVASAGDVNGDGYGDVLVGSSSYDGALSDEGRALVYLGSAGGLATTAAWSVLGGQAGAALGNAVASAGDVNGDGFGDVIVGSDGYDGALSDEGRALVYLGSGSGLATTAAWSVLGGQAGAALGGAVSGAGDINRDGYGEVIVGSSGYDGGELDEGRALVFFGGAAGLTTSAAWSAEGNQAGAAFGAAVAAAGDVDGDGHADVIVGSPGYDAGELDEGGAFVYLGSAAGLATSAAWAVQSDQAGARLGASVAGAGDVNGDGYADVVVGASAYDGGQTDEGRAYVYLGGAAGLATSAAWTYESDQSSAGFGGAVASAGDVDGDGYADLLVGASGYDRGESDEGRAFLYRGSAAGLRSVADATAESDLSSAGFGVSVASAGDVNGDGYGDVIVGADSYADRGRAFAYLGSATGLSATAAWSIEGTPSFGFFGNAVASAGDVNGDGYGDVIVGAYANNDVLALGGRAFVYLGSASGLSTTATWTAAAGQASAAFGWSVSSAGDVNGDGYGDVIVGARFYDAGQADEGRAFVYLGSAAGLGTSVAWSAESNQANGYFGVSVASAGDVNGDGYGDVIVGALQYDNGQTDEGRAYVYHGGPTGLAAAAARALEGNQSFAYFGCSVASAGDVNGDGYGDVVVGAYGWSAGQNSEGRAFLYLGGGSGTPASYAWSVESDQANAQLGRSVASAGDVNGDGYGDVLVGAPRYDDGQTDEGRAFLYLGAAVVSNPPPVAWVANGDQADANFGSALAGALDMNGDGYGDIVVGAPAYDNGQTDEGRTWLFAGNGGDGTTAAFVLAPHARRVGTSTPVTSGNALVTHTFDVVTGVGTHFGRGRARLELEVKPSLAAFDGTGTVLASSYEDVVSLDSRIIESASLAFGLGYQYRTRLRYDPSQAMGQLASHWYYGGVSGQARGLHLRTCVDVDGDDHPDPVCGGDDSCPIDPGKAAPGQCGCGIADTDTDADTTADCNDACPIDPGKTAAGLCGCGVADTDTDGDAIPDCFDGCPNDPNKVAALVCGCGIAETDSDSDGTPNCNDGCPLDPLKLAPLACGCGALETDSDGDLTPNCVDGCPNDSGKVAPLICGCGTPETDSDGDGTPNCNDGCPNDPGKITPLICGCGVLETDTDGDGMLDCNDGCPIDPNKLAAGQCGCGIADTDGDGDGTANCNDACPIDPNKSASGQCGCGVVDTDTDSDGIANCVDGCPNDPTDTTAPCGMQPAAVSALGQLGGGVLAAFLLIAGALPRARRRRRRP